MTNRNFFDIYVFVMWRQRTVANIWSILLFLDSHEVAKIQPWITVVKISAGSISLNARWPSVDRGDPFIPSLPHTLLYLLVSFTFSFFLFRERDTYVHVRYMLSQFRLSVVCDVGAPYSGGWNFRQFFHYTIAQGL